MVPCLGKEIGADVNKAANDGATRLMMSAQNDHLGVVRCLHKDLGADIDKVNLRKLVPLPCLWQLKTVV